MTLRFVCHVDLPVSRTDAGFDHGDVDAARGIAYVAHTANDSLEVVDLRGRRHLRSLPGFPGVAGALFSEERDLIFGSNRAETSVSFFPVDRETEVRKIATGGRPNGLAFDPTRGYLLAANIGRLEGRAGYSVSVVDVAEGRMITDIEVPGRTRWAVFDGTTNRFYVNIRDPPQIVGVDATLRQGIAISFPIPSVGPHGLGLDEVGRRLFCACDGGRLCVVDLATGRIADVGALSGPPDVVFFHPRKHHLYVAVGDPGVIDVFDTRELTRLESVPTEPGAGTLLLDTGADEVSAILQSSHRLAVFRDE